jgi:7,8-dihydropterin-6-yl-methyl-4-(beta-D-ribofuranosyl)aminobenzene 5'-phosphate synthase
MKVTLRTLCENTAGVIGAQAEWGWSILVETGNERVLVDAGAEGVAVQNADMMGVNLRNIDKLLLSHAHRDHSGGLRHMLKRTGPLEVIAHPAVWEEKCKTDPDGRNPQYNGIPYAKSELERLAHFNLQIEPVRIGEFMTTTGEVPMETQFETIEPNFRVKTEDGLRPDSFPDYQALVVKHPKGLVVVLGCAHRGIINTLLHARKLTGEDRVYAVVGGTHLYPKNEQQVKETVQVLKTLRVEHVGVSHCTGFSAARRLADAFGADFFLNTAGTVTVLQ